VTKVALITGSGGDIGRQTALALSAASMTIVAADVDDAGLTRTVTAVTERGGQAAAAHLDVTDKAQVESAIAQISQDHGPVTVLINCAGNLRPTRVIDIPEEEWDLVVGVNLKGTFLCSQAVLPGMIAQGWGRIVNLSSTAGKNVSTVGGAHYTAAKAGILGFTRHLASEVAAHGITVNSVCPGLIDTQMVSKTISAERMAEYGRSFPIPRLGKPDEVAAMIRYLVSEEAAYVTGASFDINGGDLMI
jgi:NAD(P)-dependent dehydrogenase (short-subunit alcohol dehydrogenase family)